MEIIKAFKPLAFKLFLSPLFNQDFIIVHMFL